MGLCVHRGLYREEGNAFWSRYLAFLYLAPKCIPQGSGVAVGCYPRPSLCLGHEGCCSSSHLGPLATWAKALQLSLHPPFWRPLLISPGGAAKLTGRYNCIQSNCLILHRRLKSPGIWLLARSLSCRHTLGYSWSEGKLQVLRDQGCWLTGGPPGLSEAPPMGKLAGTVGLWPFVV